MTGNARIARNTLALYFRSILTMVVALYTSRIVLNELGASDYGLYSLVGGVLALMSFFNTSMASSTQRFLNFEKGKRNTARLRGVFGTSLYIHILLVGGILLMAETVGLWFLNTQLNIDPGRMDAANWVYQCTVLSFLAGTIVSPYVASIVANERMTTFAYVTLLGVCLKLLAAYLLQVMGGDKLELFAVLTLIASLVPSLIYMLYARRNFPECRAGPCKDNSLLRQMLSFTSWTLTSHISVILRTQGLAIILNLFFGTLINAALGIAMQVNGAIRSFSTNFTQALNPQIVQNYAADALEKMRTLVMSGCRLSFFLVLLFSLPALIETETILRLWLKNVPDYTVIFVRLILIQSLVEAMAGPMATAQGATGNVKRYHLTLSIIGLMNLPASYMLLKAGLPPYVTFYVAILFSAIIGVSRIIFLRKSINLSMRAFVRDVVTRCSLVAILAPVVPVMMHYLMDDSLVNAFIICAVSCISVIIFVALFGINDKERKFFFERITKKLTRV
ncbi:MAG: lipopolysaccharide biosynthesis protein [Sphingomonadaceae bacterium]